MGEGEERVRDRDGSAGYDGVDYLSLIGTAWQGNWPTVIGFCAHAGLRVPSFGVDTSQTKTIDRFTRLVSSCGDVVDSVFEFDADGCCHAEILRRDGKCVTSQDLTPYPDQRWLGRFLRTERAAGSIGGIGTRVVLNMRQARERRRGFRRGSWRGGSEWLRGGVAWTIGVPGGVLVNGRRGRESSGPRWECRV